MKITFIRPNMSPERSFDAMEPLVFGILSSLTPEHIERELIDERVEEVDFGRTTDLVAMTVETFTARRAYQIGRRFRESDVPVVMGGFHPTFLPDEALQYADAVVVGDAEDTWPRVIEDVAGGRLQRVYRSSLTQPLLETPCDRSVFRGKPYNRLRPVQAGRGCRYNCDFCSINAFYGRTLRQRSASAVAREIEELDASAVLLVDDNLFVDRAQVGRLLRELAPLRTPWACQTGIDIASDPALLDLLAWSGCVAVLIGFESLNPANLRQMGKRWNLAQGAYPDVVQHFRDRGIMVCGTFVFGYDHDTEEAFDLTAEFAIDSKLALANFNPLTPTPATPLCERLVAEGRMRFDRWWVHRDYRYGDALFEPRGMSSEALSEGCFRARRRFNTFGSMLRRAMDRKANGRDLTRLGLFALANLVSRREIFRKQGMRLGSESAPDPTVQPTVVEPAEVSP